MPLIGCPDCLKEISDAAISCPNCGLPRPLYELQNRARRAGEAVALAEHLTKVRWMYGAGAVACLAALILTIIAATSPWSSELLPTKGKQLLVAIVAAGLGYGILRLAKRTAAAPP